MKRLLFALPVMILMMSLIPAKDQYVQFAEAKAKMQQAPYNDPNVFRLYFDRMGFLYPDYNLTDAQLKASYSMLKGVYFNDNKLYNSICEAYRVKPKADVENLSTDNDPLQDAIVNGAAAHINEMSKNYTRLVVLIHGGNKAPMGEDGSGADFDKMRNTISNRLPGEKIMYVEIYWDGCHDNSATMANMDKVWENAQIASCNAGLELRRIFNKVKKDKVYVVTHDLGASVATAALFNVHKFRTTAETNPDLAFEKLYDNNKYQTPSGVYKVGMLAPTIPGENTFDDYYQRTARPGQMSYNNYRFVTSYNANDEILSKWVSSPAYLGNTTLGCQHGEIYSLTNRFNNDVFNSIDFSKDPYGNPQTNHTVQGYLGAEAFGRFATDLFQN